MAVFTRAGGIRGNRALGIALAMLTLVLSGCTGSDGAQSARDDGIIRVPAEAPTLTQAEEWAQPGDVILIAPGVYEEQLLITTPDILVRGESRDGTVIDGGGVRPYGIVAMADGVRVENLTVTDATFYGLLFTGLHDESGPSAPTASGYEPWDPAEFPPLQRFLADHVTAVNNGLYGIYAFNAQHGVIRDSYASGSADSGLYVGQCAECDILITGNVAERNAVGFENSNASDSVVVVGNRFSGNRVGMTLLSSYQEAFLPQRANTVVGNVITDNNEPATPAQASGGFGTGIGINGGVGNLIARNVIAGHERAGVVLTNTEDLPAIGNAMIDVLFADNLVDVVNISAPRAAAVGNCAAPVLNALPDALGAELAGGSCAPAADAGTGTPQSSAEALPGPQAPRGISFRQVALPRAQPDLARAAVYERLPDTVAMPDPATIGVPSFDLLAERTGTR